jgi:hypothetical protein
MFSDTSASCPDSNFNPDSYRERGGETAKIKQIRKGCQPYRSGVNPIICRNAAYC